MINQKIKSEHSHGRLEFIVTELERLQPTTLVAASTPLTLGIGLTLYTLYEAGGKTALEIGLGTIAAGCAYLAYRIGGLKKGC